LQYDLRKQYLRYEVEENDEISAVHTDHQSVACILDMGLDAKGSKHAMVRWRGEYTGSTLLKWNDSRISKAHKDDFARRQAKRRQFKQDVYGKLHQHSKTAHDSTNELSRPDDRAIDPGVKNFKKISGKSKDEYSQWTLHHPTLRQTLPYDTEQKEMTDTQSAQEWINNSMTQNWFDASVKGTPCRGAGIPAKTFIKIIEHEVQTCPTPTPMVRKVMKWATSTIASMKRNFTKAKKYLFMGRCRRSFGTT
jgi:hypothetical protein